MCILFSSFTNAVPSILTCTTTTFSPQSLTYHHILTTVSHIQAILNIYSPALASEADKFPETRADGEPRERGESLAELGISKFAIGEPAK